MKHLTLFICLVANVLTAGAQEFSLSWIDEDARMRAAGARHMMQVNREKSAGIASGMDIRFHRLVLSLDPAVRFITGSVSSYFMPTIQGNREIRFDLHDSLKVTAIRYHGELLTDFQHLNNKLIIRLPAPPPMNIPDSVMVDYQGAPVEDGMGSFTVAKHLDTPVLYTLSEPYGAKDWWPCSQDLNDKVDSVHLVITVPKGNRAAANGMLIAEQHCDDRSIYQWKHRHPIAAYLVAVAVTNYSVFSTFVPVDGRSPIEILNYVYPEDSAAVAAQMPLIIKPFQLFNGWFGLYPYADERYGHAQWNWGGGMEHQTMSFMGSFGYDLMAHELAHQWFGDFITCGSWRDIWLNEGFATYLTGLCYEHDQGGIYWEPFKRLSIRRVLREPGGSVYCYDTTDVDRIFDARLSYSKGAMVLHMLRWEMGDGNFFRALNNYLYDPKHANGYALTGDLVRHCEAVADTSFREFFNDWVYGSGYPTYKVVYRQGEGTSLELEITQEQSDPAVSFFEMDVEVRLFGQGEPGRAFAVGEGVPAFAGMTTLRGEGDPLEPTPARAFTVGEGVLLEPAPAKAGAGMTRGDGYIDIRLRHSYDGQVFKIDPGFRVDSVRFDPNRWICTDNPVVLNVSEVPYAQQVRVYPNPVSEELCIDLTLPEEGLAVRIFSQSGQLVHQETPAPGHTRLRIPAGRWAPGIYVVEAAGQRQKVVVR